MLHTLELMPNFDFYVCLRIKFHKSSFWVLILAAGGPYWVSISQKNGSLLGPYLKAKGSLIVLGTVLWGAEVLCATLPGGSWTQRHSRVKCALSSLAVYCGVTFVCEPYAVF